MKVALMSVSLGHQCRGLVTAPGKEQSWLHGWPRGKQSRPSSQSAQA